MNHLIHRQIVELELQGGESPFSLQNEVSRMCREHLPRILEQVFDELAPGSVHYRLERLEIELGVIHGPNLEQALLTRVREVLQEALRRTGPVPDVAARSGTVRREAAAPVSEPQPTDVEVLSAETSDELLLREFLETGLVPWWAGTVEGAELEARFVALLEHRAGPVLTWLRGHAGVERIVRRLLGQFSPPTTLTLLQTLAREAGVDSTLAVLVEVAPQELPASRWRRALVELLLPVMLAAPRGQPDADTVLAVAVEAAMALGADVRTVRETWSRHVPSAPASWAPEAARDSSGRTWSEPGSRNAAPATGAASLTPEPRQAPELASPPTRAPRPPVETGDLPRPRKEASPAQEVTDAPRERQEDLSSGAADQPPPLVSDPRAMHDAELGTSPSHAAKVVLAPDSPQAQRQEAPARATPREPVAEATEPPRRVPPAQVDVDGAQLTGEPLLVDGPRGSSPTAREVLAPDSPRAPTQEARSRATPRAPVVEATEPPQRVPPAQVDVPGAQLTGEPLPVDDPRGPSATTSEALAPASHHGPPTEAPAHSRPRAPVSDATEPPRHVPPAQVNVGTARQTEARAPGARSGPLAPGSSARASSPRHPSPSTSPRTFTSAALEAHLKFGLSVENAGVVILHPFLRTFFEAVGLIEGKGFRDFAARCRAVCLLQWLVHEDGAEDEHRMALSKVLCGVPLEEVVPRLGGPTETERAEGELLLQHVVTQWAVLKNTSTRGLREAFLQRKGILRHEESGWMLRLESRPYDMLLERLPWGVSHIRLSWMTSLLRVER